MKLIYLLFFCSWLWCIDYAYGESSNAGTVSQSDRIRTQIEALGSSEEGRNQQLKEIYLQTLTYLNQQQQFDSSAHQFNLLITEFTKRSENLDKQQAKYRRAVVPKLRFYNVSELEYQLSVYNAKLLDLDNQEDGLVDELSLINSRRLAIPELLTNQKSLLQPVIDELGKDKIIEDSEINAATEGLGNTHLEAIKSHIKMLELELLSSSNQQSLTEQQIELLDIQLEDLSQLTIIMQGRLAELRRQTTAKTVAKSKRLSNIDQTSHSLLRQQALLNEQFSNELTELTSEVEQAILAKNLAQEQSDRVGSQFKRIKNQLHWLKASSSFGQTMQAELSRLPKLPDMELLADRLGGAQFATYELEQQIELLSESDLHIKDLATNQAESPLTSEEYKSLTAIIEGRLPLLVGLLAGHRSLLSEIAQQEVATRELFNMIQQFKALVDQHLLWVPNTRPVGSDQFVLLKSSLSWLVSQTTWQQLPEALNKRPRALWRLLALGTLLLMLSLVLRWRLERRYADYAAMIGKVTKDKFRHTCKIIIHVGIYSLALPLVCFLLGRLLVRSDGQPFAIGVGHGLIWISGMLWLWLWFKDLSKPQGFFCEHLQWNERDLTYWVRQLRRLVWFSVPMMMLISIAQAVDTEVMRSSLGRSSFVLWCIGYSLFFWRAMRANDVFLPLHSQNYYNLRWTLLVIAPTIFGAIALYGYFYTGLQLMTMMLHSLLIGCGLIIFYFLAMRGMLVQERRIAFKQAKAKRAEALASRVKEEDAGSEISADLIDEEYIDLKTVSEQTRGMILILLWIAFGVSILIVWAPALRGLDFLESVTMWESTTIVGGVEQTVPVTLRALLISISTLLLMWITVRNLPGVMQLLVLQHLNLSPGTGYAFVTLLNYMLLFLGVMISFNVLGFDWSKLQWLVAALGVGLGFGLHEIFANFISGLIILFEKPIRIGDTVTINNLTGTVSKIQIRATTIVDWDRKEIIVPNKSFITEELVNWSLSDPITRIIITVGVAYGSDNPLVERLLLQAAQEASFVLDTPKPEAYFVGFEDSTLNYEVRGYVNMVDRMPAIHALHNQIDAKFREHQVQIAFPQLDVHLRRQ